MYLCLLGHPGPRGVTVVAADIGASEWFSSLQGYRKLANRQDRNFLRIQLVQQSTYHPHDHWSSDVRLPIRSGPAPGGPHSDSGLMIVTRTPRPGKKLQLYL